MESFQYRYKQKTNTHFIDFLKWVPCLLKSVEDEKLKTLVLKNCRDDVGMFVCYQQQPVLSTLIKKISTSL